MHAGKAYKLPAVLELDDPSQKWRQLLRVLGGSRLSCAAEMELFRLRSLHHREINFSLNNCRGNVGTIEAYPLRQQREGYLLTPWACRSINVTCHA